ncbi:MBL fold metallo-hydrolase [Paracoccus sp. MBLB3053]|uniref:MBL fold metallo-hydrolase n=1 Tax=Paracoccus aurantius TaxID=3073814 RepID=A0ABU2HVZ1_9RHOB|nr:MBL fold metallo-hydrolase [Paracoccus sp. MBLB3053]MDS9468902.1 MBL fold metallo-hydrolase [Paracoccus sp. MBLB3053]
MKTCTILTMAFSAGLCLAGPALAETRVVILGTGTPVPDFQRAGPGMAVIHDGEAYVFDIGAGVVRRMIEAAQDKGIKELMPMNVKHLFISHLHSDHTIDFPELAATYWWRRDARIEAYGPVGLQAMTDGYYDMQAVDIHLRTSGNQPVQDPTMYQVGVHEISQDGIILDENGVTVEAFSVDHGDIHPAYGYKITTPDKTIVFSGDTTYSETLAEKAKGVDVLVHEVISEEGWKALEPNWQEYHHSSHTLTSELARIANEARPGTLVLTHILHYGAPIETARTEIEALYDGPVILANDLDEF